MPQPEKADLSLIPSEPLCLPVHLQPHHFEEGHVSPLAPAANQGSTLKVQAKQHRQSPAQVLPASSPEAPGSTTCIRMRVQEQFGWIGMRVREWFGPKWFPQLSQLTAASSGFQPEIPALASAHGETDPTLLPAGEDVPLVILRTGKPLEPGTQ